MKFIYLFILIAFLPLFCNGQNVSRELLCASSGELKSNNYLMHWTIGDFVVETLSTNEIIITQGMLQPRFIMGGATSIKKPEMNFDISPNPFSSSIVINSTLKDAVSYDIIDITGRLIAKGMMYSELSSINTSSISSGIYFIRVFNLQNEILYNQKIIKK